MLSGGAVAFEQKTKMEGEGGGTYRQKSYHFPKLQGDSHLKASKA